MDEIEIGGMVRKMGTLVPMPGFVSAFPQFEASIAVMDDETIKNIVTDPGRKMGRKAFGDEWITDQKSHGSCNGFAGASALSRARYLRGIRDKLILSGSYIYSHINGGRDNGSLLEDGMKELQQYGAPPLAMCPWNMIYRNETKQFDAEAAKRKGFEAYAAGTMQGFKTGLAMGFMGVCAVHVGNNFGNLSAGGVAGIANGPGNHAEAVDNLEWDGSRWLYDIPGSWGLNYAQRGRYYHVDAHFAQTFANHKFYLIRSTEEAE
jgi:hypothetical protein